MEQKSRFSREQIQRARGMPLVPLLQARGIHMKQKGREMYLTDRRYRGITVNGSKWYSHYERTGGGPVEFLQRYGGMSEEGAIGELLGLSLSIPRDSHAYREQERKKAFALPAAAPDHERALHYLTKVRLIAPDIAQHFLDTGQIYECLSTNPTCTLHNIAFVGRDRKGVPRQAHCKGMARGSGFRFDVENSDGRYGFGYYGKSDRLYVFEAALDLLSFLTLYPDRWQDHSYVALGGVAEHAMMTMLRCHPGLQEVILCLDHDPGGQMATMRLRKALLDRPVRVSVRQPGQEKDWNEMLYHRAGFSFLPASDDRQLAEMKEYAAQLYVEVMTADRNRVPSERAELALTQFEVNNDLTALHRCAVCAGVQARRLWEMTGAPFTADVFETGTCVQAALDNPFYKAVRQLEQIREDEARFPCFTKPQCHTLAMEWMTLAGQCMVQKLQEEQMEQENQEELSW